MSTKWADYGISAVSYDESHSRIEQLRIHPDNGTSMGAAQVNTRVQVVSMINGGSTFVTIRKNGNNEWTRGEEVGVVSNNGSHYLRTDRNGIAADNLGNLPEF